MQYRNVVENIWFKSQAITSVLGETQYVINDLIAGKSYEFVVFAYNEAVRSSPSDPVDTNKCFSHQSMHLLIVTYTRLT